MLNEQKYKRWAWGALIGLAVIIVIAGIIMVSSASSPKPNKEVATANTEVANGGNDEKATEDTKTNDQTTQNDQKTETQPATTEDNSKNSSSQEQSNSGSVAPATTNNIPKTGPEDAILPVVSLAIIGYLFAYNVALFKKNA